MRWLMDNNVPRSVTLLLRDAGHEAVEVREALSEGAPDADIDAYARSQGMTIVTHDRGLARRAARMGTPHLWLRTAEPSDRSRVDDQLVAIETRFLAGATRVVLTKRGLVG